MRIAIILMALCFAGCDIPHRVDVTKAQIEQVLAMCEKNEGHKVITLRTTDEFAEYEVEKGEVSCNDGAVFEVDF